MNKHNKEPYLLYNWSVICTTSDIKYKAPELYEYSLQGNVCNHYKYLNDTSITTSSIKSIDSLIIHTISNSIYKLEGPPHNNYQDFRSLHSLLLICLEILLPNSLRKPKAQALNHQIH